LSTTEPYIFPFLPPTISLLTSSLLYITEETPSSLIIILLPSYIFPSVAFQHFQMDGWMGSGKGSSCAAICF